MRKQLARIPKLYAGSDTGGGIRVKFLSEYKKKWYIYPCPSPKNSLTYIVKIGFRYLDSPTPLTLLDRKQVNKRKEKQKD